MRRLAAAAAVLLLGSGCARVTHYQLVVEPGFTPEQEEAIFSAADGWSRVVPVTFDYVRGACPSPLWNTICVQPTQDLGVQPEHPGLRVYGNTDKKDELDYSAYVHLLSSGIPTEYFQHTAAHELGHAQGLVHHGEGTLMYYDCVTSDPDPKEDDADQWWHLH